MFYTSLSCFAEIYYNTDRPDRVKSANGWNRCECKVNGKWIFVYDCKKSG